MNNRETFELQQKHVTAKTFRAGWRNRPSGANRDKNLTLKRTFMNKGGGIDGA
jgi:hypothetical protein